MKRMFRFFTFTLAVSITLNIKNWQVKTGKYGSKYETVYHFPEYVEEDGQFLDGVYMIALDITVENQKATNEYINGDGEKEVRYGNPYIFKTDSFPYLMSKESDHLKRVPGFFSLGGKRPEYSLQRVR